MKYNSLLFGSKREEPGFWKGKEGRILPEKIIIMARQLCCCGTNLYGSKLISITCFAIRVLSLLLLTITIIHRDSGINPFTIIFIVGLTLGIIFDIILFIGTFLRSAKFLLSWFIFR